jgi:tripartite-type tricarboxylate transporter receptor subunit TctC
VIALQAGTPKEIVSKVKAALDGTMALPDVQQQIIRLGMIPGASASSEELQRFIGSEITRWGKIVTQAGLAGTE